MNFVDGHCLKLLLGLFTHFPGALRCDHMPSGFTICKICCQHVQQYKNIIRIHLNMLNLDFHHYLRFFHQTVSHTNTRVYTNALTHRKPKSHAKCRFDVL